MRSDLSRLRVAVGFLDDTAAACEGSLGALCEVVASSCAPIPVTLDAGRRTLGPPFREEARELDNSGVDNELDLFS